MDAETQQVAEKLARFVAEGGPEVEAIAAERNRDNPAFRSVTMYLTVFFSYLDHVLYLTPNVQYPSLSFLYAHQSPAYRFYKKKVEEYRLSAAFPSSSPPAAESRTEVQPPPAPPLQQVPPPLNSAPLSQNQEAEAPPVKRKRKSRWGAEDDKIELPIPPIIVPPELNGPDPNTPSLSGTRTCVLHATHTHTDYIFISSYLIQIINVKH